MLSTDFGTNFDERARREGKGIMLCVILMIAIFAVDSSVPLGVAGGVPYVLVVLVSLRTQCRVLTFYVALLGSALTIAAFFTSPPGGEFWKVVSNRFLALFAIWVTALLGVQRDALRGENAKALGQLRAFHALVPTCSLCHRIRGHDGLWKTVESIIRDSTEADASERLCPDCEKAQPGACGEHR